MDSIYLMYVLIIVLNLIQMMSLSKTLFFNEKYLHSSVDNTFMITLLLVVIPVRHCILFILYFCRFYCILYSMNYYL